eukprot:gene8777-18048_t
MGGWRGQSLPVALGWSFSGPRLSTGEPAERAT